jgi:hypothetical protein
MRNRRLLRRINKAYKDGLRLDDKELKIMDGWKGKPPNRFEKDG